MDGRYHFGFYATADTASTSGVPSAENDHGTLPLSAADEHLHRWVVLRRHELPVDRAVLPARHQFWDLSGDLDPSCLGLYWSWYYFLPAGGDESCRR